MRTHDQTLRRLADLEQAVRSGADPYDCAAERWECWMLLGKFEQAWRESDFIAASGTPDPHRFWNGERWSGRRVMLRCLHGLGDTIQFVRYAPLLRETCAKLIVQAHPELVRLLAHVRGIDEVVSWGPGYYEDNSRWDIQMEIMELPRAFRTTIADVPANTPYIEIAPAPFERDNRVRIGIVWESSAWDIARSVPAALLEPLLEVDGCQFFSFQKDTACNLIDVLDTATLMRQMDLVITVDTMAAHLAGALGIPVWIMLPQKSDWRWMLERKDSPWYPRARLFRQNEKAGWKGVIDQVVEQLRERVAAGNSMRFASYEA